MPTCLRSKCEPGSGPDIGPIQTVGMAVQPFAALRNRILSLREIGLIGPVRPSRPGGRQPAAVSRYRRQDPYQEEQHDRRGPADGFPLRSFVPHDRLIESIHLSLCNLSVSRQIPSLQNTPWAIQGCGQISVSFRKPKERPCVLLLVLSRAEKERVGQPALKCGVETNSGGAGF